VLRLYLMATPCSGKTMFAREHPSHRGVEVLDFDFGLQLGPRWHGWLRRAAGRAGIPIPPRSVLDGLDPAARLDAWYVLARRRLSEAPGPLCLLGPAGVPDTESWPGMRFALVELPLEEHLERALVRHERWPWDRSSRPSVVRKHRAWAHEHAESKAIPIYASFLEALDAALADPAAPGKRA
jgi:hypothetical protein